MKRSTAPQLQVAEPRRGFTWVDGVVMLSLLAIFWSALHFGKGMLVRFDAASQPAIDLSVSMIPYYGRTHAPADVDRVRVLAVVRSGNRLPRRKELAARG